MTRLVIVPSQIDAGIKLLLDQVIAQVPDAEASRPMLHDQLVGYYDEHGCLPTIDQCELVKKPKP